MFRILETAVGILLLIPLAALASVYLDGCDAVERVSTTGVDQPTAQALPEPLERASAGASALPVVGDDVVSKGSERMAQGDRGAVLQEQPRQHDSGRSEIRYPARLGSFCSPFQDAAPAFPGMGQALTNDLLRKRQGSHSLVRRLGEYSLSELRGTSQQRQRFEAAKLMFPELEGQDPLDRYFDDVAALARPPWPHLDR